MKDYLKSQKIPYRDESVKKYLYNLKKYKQIYDAGRGWYSNIKQPFVLNTKPVEKMVQILKTQFPLLKFSCWSTEQLQSYFHHLQIKYVTFVYSESDYLSSLFENLREKFSNIYLNPNKKYATTSFYLTENTIVLRPSITEEPQKDHFASIEKILIDLYIERIKLQLLDEWEYKNLFQTIINNHRLNIASLLRYANRRAIKTKIQRLIH